jgi:hypothetical protein
MKWQKELEKARSTKGLTDKRHIGSVLGASVFGVIGFIVAPVIGGIAGGVLGFGLGHAVGRRFKRNRKNLNNLNLTNEYELHLECVLTALQ